MKTSVTHRALFSVLLCMFGLALTTGCAIISNAVPAQFETSQEEVLLNRPISPGKDLSSTIMKIATNMGYSPAKGGNPRRGDFRLQGEPASDGEKIMRNVGFLHNTTLVSITLTPEGNVFEISVEVEGNDSQHFRPAQDVAKAFKDALEKQFNTTATAKQ